MYDSLFLGLAILAVFIGYIIEEGAKIRLGIPIRASYNPARTYLVILFAVAGGITLVAYPLLYREQYDYLTKLIITFCGLYLFRAGVLWEAIPIIVGTLNRGQSSLGGMGDSSNPKGESDEDLEEKVEADQQQTG